VVNLNDHVTITRAEYDLLVLDAGSWRLLNTSPHVAEILDEWIEWDQRRTLRETSNAISAATDWRRESTIPTYRELERRRAEPVVPRRCGGPGCMVVLSVPYPAPTHPVFCPTHNRSLGVAA
jgi:hypothetical protein